MAEVTPVMWLWVALAALPLVVAMATAFTKSLVVIGSLRTGLGAEAFLPWPAVLAVSVVVTVVVMAPTGMSMLEASEVHGGVDALMNGSAPSWLATLDPLLEFVGKHASLSELEFFAELQGRTLDDPLVTVPAFLVTELGEALAIAVVILVPFVLVDLVAAQVLALVGVGQLPVALVTVPAKILLFLAVGGWDVVIGGLVRGYT